MTAMQNRKPGPSFLGIGPPKTATSWLYYSLKQHPGAHLPPMKEIGYLWEKRFLPERRYSSLFFNNHWYYRDRRRYLADSFRAHARHLALLRIDFHVLRWDVRYAFFPHTDSWYSHLFDKHSVSGEIFPKYCELHSDDLADIKRRYSDLKIIITVRDPIEREWSRAKMNLCKKRNLQPADVPDERWLKHFNEPGQSSANDYAALYDRWSECFGKKHVHLIFFDEIQDDGWGVFRSLCRFLGLNELDESFEHRICKASNVGIKSNIPRRYERYLFAQHKDKMVRFANAFPNYRYPEEWLRRHEEKT